MGVRVVVVIVAPSVARVHYDRFALLALLALAFVHDSTATAAQNVEIALALGLDQM